MNDETPSLRKCWQRDAYIPIVTGFLPGCLAPELQLRCSLLMLRDMATSQMRRCSDEADGIYRQVVRLVTHHGLTAMTLQDLTTFRAVMVRLTLCATSLEGLAAPDSIDSVGARNG